MSAWYQPIEQLISETIRDLNADISTMFSRHDGHLIFKIGKSSEKDLQSASALVCGAWQAVNSLKDYIKKDTSEIYRLSFDTTSSGVFVVPIYNNNEQYYLTFLYSSLLNPGSLKAKIRLIKEKIEKLNCFDEIKLDSNNKYLFKNVTDEEVDNLFSSMEI